MEWAARQSEGNETRSLNIRTGNFWRGVGVGRGGESLLPSPQALHARRHARAILVFPFESVPDGCTVVW